MKWNNIIYVKIGLKNIDNNCNNVVEYLENRYGEDFIKEKSLIGAENGESVFLVRTFKKINEKDLVVFKEMLGNDYICAKVKTEGYSFD
ncbi:hypothetical protein [Cetobacterium sp.]|uniref:hypothetical protein n=1 Tax=Cetobacterium sp. TaxID=2071632 RepID=UPI003F3F12FB